MSATGPLLFLDVDGPLNPYAAKPSRRPTGYETHRLRPSGWDFGRPLRVWLNPCHGPQLLALPLDLVWATAWEHDANKMIGPVIGLPELPVVTFPESGEPDPDRLFWKTRRLVEYAAGRPFAWVDDEVTEVDRAWVAANHGAAALLLKIDPRLGLRAADFTQLAAWAVATPQTSSEAAR